MRIGELAKRTGVSVRSLRHYEKKGLIRAVRMPNGYRTFDEVAVERVRAVQLYLGLGLTTEQIERILNCNGIHAEPEPNPVCEELLAVYERKLAEVEQKIHALEQAKALLLAQMARFHEARRRKEAVRSTGEAVRVDR